MNNNLLSLDGLVAIVTGAGSGIGRASATMMATAGARVVVSDVDEGGGRATVDAIVGNGGTAIFVEADVADAAAVDRLVAAAVATYGRLDCAHNNAGVDGDLLPTADVEERAWDRSIAVNLKGVWLCMRAELRQFLKQGDGGAIVNTSSVGGLRAVPYSPAYSAAKHGVIGLTKTAAVEYAAQNIRVNAICPGFTRSAMTDRLIAKVPDLFDMSTIPIGRSAGPEEIAGMVAFLCSPLASYLTGEHISIDGAFTAR